MQKTILLLALVLSITYAEELVSFSATLESFYLDCDSHEGEGHDFADNLRRDVNNAEQPDGYCSVTYPNFSWPTNNQNICSGATENLGWKFEQTWYQGTASHYRVEFGASFKRGGAVFVDNAYYTSSKSEIWWNNDWSYDGILVIDADFTEGYHSFQIFGSENVGDGYMDCRFSLNNGDFLSCNNWSSDNSCPEVTCDQVTLYSDCCYAGDVHVVEGASDDCLAFEPKSICIPYGVQATFYDLCQYEGQSVTFTSNVACLDSISYDLLARYGITMNAKKAKNLKTNSKSHARVEIA